MAISVRVAAVRAATPASIPSLRARDGATCSIISGGSAPMQCAAHTLLSSYAHIVDPCHTGQYQKAILHRALQSPPQFHECIKA